MSRLLEALHSGRVLVMDGAMGTELQRLGLRDDECSAQWNLTHPEEVARVHAAYLEAGAEVLLTNTFMANTSALARHGLRARESDIWQAAIGLARVWNPGPIVLADIGPAFQATLPGECIQADAVILETWSCSERVWPQPAFPELNSAILLSFTYRHVVGCTPLTHEGARPEDCALVATMQLGVQALGANCGCDVDMDDMLEIVRRYRDITDLPLFVRPNAGTPTRTATGWRYPHSPEEMADKLWPLLEAGATMVGGCCGTTPAHIAAFRRVVDEWNRRQAAG